MSDQPPVRTALFDEHLALDANMVDFHGFELPIWYSNIKEEHLETRRSAGLFDVSHMGQLYIEGGSSVEDALEKIIPADLKNLDMNQSKYSLMKAY